MKDLHDIALDRKQDAIGVRATTVEQLPNFYGRVSIFRSERATRRKTMLPRGSVEELLGGLRAH